MGHSTVDNILAYCPVAPGSILGLAEFFKRNICVSEIINCKLLRELTVLSLIPS